MSKKSGVPRGKLLPKFMGLVATLIGVAGKIEELLGAPAEQRKGALAQLKAKIDKAMKQCNEFAAGPAEYFRALASNHKAWFLDLKVILFHLQVYAQIFSDPKERDQDYYRDRVYGLQVELRGLRVRLSVFVGMQTKPRARGNKDSQQAGEENDGGMPALATASDIARQLGRTPSAVETALRRLRTKYPDCYISVDSPRRNESRYLYRTGEVVPRLKRLMTDE